LYSYVSDSPWTDAISREIIFLQENQDIQKIYNKWWKEKSGGKCDVDDQKKDASSLGVKHVGGVFVVLVGGLVAGLFIACLEFMWKARKNAKKDKVSNLTSLDNYLSKFRSRILFCKCQANLFFIYTYPHTC
jgi:hypothetical protein